MKVRHEMLSPESFTVEKRAEGDNGPVLVGHSIVANQKGDGYFFTEEVDKEAITKALSRDLGEVRMLWQHNTMLPIARYPETLELKQDDIGLWNRARVVATKDAEDMIRRVEARLVEKMSFGFFIEDEIVMPANKEREKPHFIIKDLRLIEVSPVTYPFYKGTDISLERALEIEESKFRARMTAHGSKVSNSEISRLRAKVSADLWSIRTRLKFGLPLR